MRAARYLGPALFIAGVVALAYALIQGEATLSLFLVFPIVTASGSWAFLGILLIVAGFAAFFFTWPSWGEIPQESVSATAVAPPSTATAATPTRRWGGVVFLGPVPIVFGSDAKVAQWMLLAAVALFVALLVLTLIALRAI